MSFEGLGIDGQEAFGLIDAAVEAGSRNTDAFADLLKEFGIRASEGPESVQKAYQELGVDIEEIQSLIDNQQGDVAFQRVAQAVGELNSQTDRQRLLTEAIGPQWEQTGEAAVLAAGNANLALETTNGAAERLTDTLSDGLGVRLTRIQRNVQLGFARVGDAIFDFIDDVDFAPIAEALEDAGPALAELGEVARQDVLPALTATADFVAGTLAPVFINQLSDAVRGATVLLGGLADVSRAVIGEVNDVIDSVDGRSGGNRAENREIVTLFEDLTAEAEASGEVASASQVSYDAWLQATEAGITNLSLAEFRDEVLGLEENISRVADGNNLLDASFLAVRDTSLDVAGGIAEVGEEAITAEERIDALQTRLDIFFNGLTSQQLDIQAADFLAEFADGLGDLSDLDIGAGGVFDATSDAGRRLTAVLAETQAELNEYFQAATEGTIDGLQLQRLTDGIRDSFFEAGAAAGLTRDEISTLYDEFLQPTGDVQLGVDLSTGGIDPEGLITQVQGQLTEAQQEERNQLVLQARLDGLDDLGAVIDEFGAGTTRGAALDVDTATVDRKLREANRDLDDYDRRTVEADADLDTRRADREFREITSEADLWDRRFIEARAGVDTRPAVADFDEIDRRGTTFARTRYEGLLDFSDDAIGKINLAEAAGTAFARSVYRARLDLDDEEAQRTLRDLERDRTVTLRVRTQGFTGVNAFFADGGSVSGTGIPRLASGAIMDGIAPPVPGGWLASVNGAIVNIAENRNEEMFLNAASSFDRQLGLIERFAGGRLDAQLRRHYQTQTGGGDTRITNHWSVTAPPMADPMAAMAELSRRVDNRLKTMNRPRAGAWRPR